MKHCGSWARDLIRRGRDWEDRSGHAGRLTAGVGFGRSAGISPGAQYAGFGLPAGARSAPRVDGGVSDCASSGIVRSWPVSSVSGRGRPRCGGRQQLPPHWQLPPFWQPQPHPDPQLQPAEMGLRGESSTGTDWGSFTAMAITPRDHSTTQITVFRVNRHPALASMGQIAHPCLWVPKSTSRGNRAQMQRRCPGSSAGHLAPGAATWRRATQAEHLSTTSREVRGP